MKKILALLLMMAMAASLFAGCGSTGASAAAAVASDGAAELQESVQAAEAPAEQPAAEGSEAEAAASAAEQDAAAENEPVELEYPNYVTFPFTEEAVTLSLFTRSPSGNPLVMPGSYNEYAIFSNLEEQSNVHIDWHEFTNEAAETQFNLMCASGDYTDIMTGVTDFYSGGISKCYEDGIIDDMADAIADYAPNYVALMNSNESVRRNCTSDDGSMLAFYTINDEPDMAAGLFIRTDWLEQLGLEMPQTYDALTEVLTAFRDSYGCDYSLMLTESCVVGDSGDLTAGFGVPGFNVKELNRYHLFVSDEGNITSCVVDDGYRDYLSYLNGLYEQGLLGADFATISCDPFAGTTDSLIVNSRSGVFKLNCRGLDNILNNAVDETFDVAALPNIGTEAGIINHFSDASLINTNALACISSSCADVEAAVRWLDYWYSKEGADAKNYGVEGETFVYNEEGEPEFTNLIINNEWGVSVDTAITHYNIQNVMVGCSYSKLTWDYYTEIQQNAKTLWHDTADSAQVLPGSLSLTAEESDTYASNFSDIATYVAEMVPKFIMGDESLDHWDVFVDTINGMGMDECIAVYQDAYTRYLSR